MHVLSLLKEKPEFDSLDVILEQDNKTSDQNVYIQGPYMMASKKNRNRRVYDLNEMVNEVDRYKREFISTNRALGELCHPENSIEVDLTKACHVVINLEQKDNVFYGKSKVLSTPSGVILKTLLKDGIKLGISSRSLGTLVNEGETNKVRNMHLIALDVVAEPSYSDAMLDAITESKQYIIAEGGKIVELACNSLECKLNQLPKKDVDAYLKESFISFIKALRG